MKSDFHNDNVTQSIFLNLLKPWFPLKKHFRNITIRLLQTCLPGTRFWTPRKAYPITLTFFKYCVPNGQKYFEDLHFHQFVLWENDFEFQIYWLQ